MMTQVPVQQKICCGRDDWVYKCQRNEEVWADTRCIRPVQMLDDVCYVRGLDKRT